MLIKDIIKILEEQGHEVTYRTRVEGSPLITSIDGERFLGAKGNERARALTGLSLSEAKIKHLQKINPGVGGVPHRRRFAPLPQDLEKELRKAQYQWRKTATKKDGRISKSNLRWTFEHYGREEALKRLSRSVQYARGIAYEENVEYLAQRLDMLAFESGEDIFAECASSLRQNKLFIKETTIQDIYNLLYEIEKFSKMEEEGKDTDGFDILDYGYQIQNLINESISTTQEDGRRGRKRKHGGKTRTKKV